MSCVPFRSFRWCLFSGSLLICRDLWLEMLSVWYSKLLLLTLACSVIRGDVVGRSAITAAVDGSGRYELAETTGVAGSPEGKAFASAECFPACPQMNTCVWHLGRSECVSTAERCRPNPCLNGGNCIPSGKYYNCDCREQFYGDHCEHAHQPFHSSCSPNPCLNGGACRIDRGEFTCLCTGGYSGRICELSPCNPNPCLNGGTCLHHGASYSCNCRDRFYGDHCEYRQNPLDPCSPNPCRNGGRCRIFGRGFSCSCTGHFTGETCEFRTPVTSACNPNPCLNGGQCVSYGTSYRCRCEDMHYGVHCEMWRRSDSCSGLNPCKNECECVMSCRHSSGYYCRSNSGYLGKNCTIPPPVVSCQPNQVVISIDDSFVREYDRGLTNSRLHMALTAQDFVRPECYATTTSGIRHVFNVPLPFTKCNTVVESRDGKTVVTNNIWLNRVTAGGYDMPVPVISVECSYEKDYVIVTSLQPAVDQPITLREFGVQRVEGMIELCKVSSSCPMPCPSIHAVSEGAVYTIGEMIHLHIRVDQSEQSAIYLTTLYLSCGEAEESVPVLRLVEGGCPSAGQAYVPTEISHNGRSSSVCVSFQVPRLRQCNSFYVHAKIESCEDMPCARNEVACVPNPAPVGRKRRHVTPTTKSYFQIFGPIYFIKGSRGVPYEVLFPNASIVNTTALIYEPEGPETEDGIPETAVGISVLCLCLVLCSVVIALLCYRKCKSNREIIAQSFLK